jgi:gas vesicle protein
MAQKEGLNEFLFGLLLGGVLGAGAALLLAPAKGKDTREMIGHKIHGLTQSGKEEIDRVKELVKEEAAKLNEKKDAIREGLEKGVEAYKAHGKANEA